MGEVAKNVLQGVFMGGRLERFGGAVGDQGAFVDDEDAVADALHDIQDMGTVQYGLAGGGERGEQVFDEDGGIHVETGEGFIEQDDVRVVQQGGGDQDLLPHAFGIGIEAGHAVAGEAKGFQDVPDAGLQRVFGNVVEAAAEFEKLLPGEDIEKDRGFRHVADDLLDVDFFNDPGAAGVCNLSLLGALPI